MAPRTGHGRGSTKPANVKLRPVIPIEERAKPRKKGSKAAADELLDHNVAALIDELVSEGEQDDDGPTGGVLGQDEKRPLEGMQVCATGTLELSREDVRQITESLGGVFEPSLKLDTTFLIADQPDGDKYRAAVDNAIPVLHSRFLKAVHHDWTHGLEKIDVQRHSDMMRLPPLHGLKICLTGFSADPALRKMQIENIGHAGGADYSPNLDSGVTHLVVGPEYASFDLGMLDNGKIRAAMQINKAREKAARAAHLDPAYITTGQPHAKIRIVWGEWLEHSLCAFGRMREESYTVDIVKDRANLPQVAPKRAMGIVERAASPKKRDTRGSRKRSLLRQDTMQVASQAPRAGSAMATAARSPAVLVEPMAKDGEPIEVARIRKDKSQASLTRDSLSVPRVPMKRSRSPAQAEILGVQDLLNAFRPDSSVGATTSVREEDTEIKHTAAAMEPAADGSSTADISMERSAPAGKASGLSKLGDRSSKFSTGSATLEPSKKPLAAAPEQTALSAELEDPGQMTAEDAADPASTSLAEQDHAFPAQIFAGKSFYLLFQGVASELVNKVKCVISDRGGKVVTEDEPTVDYIVCKAIQAHAPEFDPDDSRLVTDAWLERCVFDDEVPNAQDPHALLYRPLRLILPIPEANAVRISYAGFDECGKSHMVKLCNALGIVCEPKVTKGKTTHLIIADPSYKSARLAACQKWNIPVVLPLFLRSFAVDHSWPRQQSTEPRAQLSTKAETTQSHVEDPRANTDQAGDDEKPSNLGPLHGCGICVSAKRENASGLRTLAGSLGANITFSPADPKTTHFVFASNRTKDNNKEFKTASERRRHIVHPDWLEACRSSGQRQPESFFKHTYVANRSLPVTFESQEPVIPTTNVGRSLSGEAHTSGTPGKDQDDEFALPAPLLQPSMNGIKQSTPKQNRFSKSTASAGKLGSRASSATPDTSPGRSSKRRTPTELRLTRSVPDLDVSLSIVDDSGYGPSSPSSEHRKGNKSTLAPDSYALNLSASTGLANRSTSSSSSSPPRSGLSLTETLNSQGQTQNSQRKPSKAPSNTAVTRDLLAEMNAIMQAEISTGSTTSAGVVATVNASSKRSTKRTFHLVKSEHQHSVAASVSASPAGSGRYPNDSHERQTSPAKTATMSSKTRVMDNTVSFFEAGLIARQQAGYDSVFESQLATLHNRHVHLGQDASVALLEQSMDPGSMVIRINDSTAEATKAKLLASIRGVSTSDNATGRDEVTTGDKGAQEGLHRMSSEATLETQDQHDSKRRRTTRTTR